MRQARTVLSTYSADTFGVCSALYELGGMIVMHDASGCNSTYTTHDEPRWVHSNSLVFISGLSEMDAILGYDEKLQNDMLAAIQELRPAFAAIAGTPIPMMTGFDYQAVASEIEAASGIPCFGFPTNGMRSYLCGVSEALSAIAERMPYPNAKPRPHTVNILGATPLDFSVSGTVSSIRKCLSDSGWNILGCWAMDSSLPSLCRAGEAQVNLVISASGIQSARVLRRKFGTPYVIGTPVGCAFTDTVLKCLWETARDGIDRIAFAGSVPEAECPFVLIGESVLSRSLAAEIGMEWGVVPRVVYPLEMLPELRGVLTSADTNVTEEEAIQNACASAETVIADPLYKPILPSDCTFIPLPHEAFSGRMFRKECPDLTRMDFLKGRIL